MLINTNQIDPIGLTLFVQQAMSGGAFSGNFVNYVTNSGFVGNIPVWTTGGAQTIAGQKTFIISPIVPYLGTSGTAPSTAWVSGQLISISGAITGNLVNLTDNQTIAGTKTFTLPVPVNSPTQTGHAVNLGYLTGVSGALASLGGATVTVTGSANISAVNISGLGGTLVFTSGTWVFISGAGQAGGGSSTATGNIVYTTGDQTISGQKIFTGNPWIAAPTVGSGAVNLNFLSGASGALYTQITGMTGYNVYNTFNITGTGTTNLTQSATGSITNTFNVTSGTLVASQTVIGTITGNYVDCSFFFDPVPTGLNLFEAFIAHNFYFTGAAFSCRSSGLGPTNGGILSGKLYQVDSNNTEQTLYQFGFQSGIIYSGGPSFTTYVTGGNRVGVSITNSLSGIQRMTIGVFGGSYV